MSGAAGHIQSPWENMDLTFGQIREIIIKSCLGTLENAKEKLDGVNILATYKSGHVYIARSLKQVRDNGAEAMRWDLVGEYMKTPESREAYSTAAKDLQNVLFTIDEEILQNFFLNGKYWLNMELLTPLMENIIPYNKNQLRIHNVQTENGVIDINFDPLLKLIKVAQEGISKTFEIDKTNKVSLKFMDPTEFLKDLDSLMENFNLAERNTIEDFLAIEFWDFIDFEFSKIRERDFNLIKSLIRRWAYLDKSTSITKLLAGKNQQTVKWVKETDKNIDSIRTVFLEQIIEIFSKVGSKVLLNSENIASSDPSKAQKSIIDKTDDAINKMSEYRGEKSKFLKAQYERFLRAGGFDSIAPIEGVVFNYEGKLFKLTGSYLPLLKIISFFRFGRDKE